MYHLEEACERKASRGLASFDWPGSPNDPHGHSDGGYEELYGLINRVFFFFFSKHNYIVVILCFLQAKKQTFNNYF